MPIFTPGRRYQLPYLPSRKKEGIQILEPIERMVKGPLWGCRMCGNCLLQETAFICPMACPKGLRNGPCGGSLEESCYLDPSYPCIWYQIFDRAKKMGREDILMEVLPPLDWDKVGQDTWGEVFRRVRQVGMKSFFVSRFNKNKQEGKKVWDSVFKPIRQPDWWQGDDQFHPPMYDEPVSFLESQLRFGKFVITTEVASPLSTATGKLLKDIKLVSPHVSAINFTDGAIAIPKMSSLACSEFAVEAGSEPILQIAARDQTRIGLQGHVIGAAARGIRNVFVVSGDSAQLGPKPMSRTDILDIDSVQMLWILRRMRDEGIYLGGRKIKYPPKIFLGAAASPFASNPHIQAIREHKKVNAGAQFLQTNLVFDADALDIWLNELAKRNILDKVYILIGIAPLKSLKMAQYMHNKVPGVQIPEKIMKRIEDAGDGVEDESVLIASELIEEVKKKEGVNGIHLMPVGWEKVVPKIIEGIR